MPEGVRPIYPCPAPDWIRLPAGRRARLTGHAGDLKGVDLTLFVVMAELSRMDGRGVSASIPTLSHESGFGTAAVRRALRRLEDGFWIRCTHRSTGGLTPGNRPNPTSCYDVLTLPADPRPKLTKSVRRAALFPDWRERPLAIPRVGKAKAQPERLPSNATGAIGKGRATEAIAK